jgi:hypothetical protein
MEDREMSAKNGKRQEVPYEKLNDDLFDPEAPIGIPRRHRHDTPSCSSGKDPCLIITRREAGWDYYCHRCGIKGRRGLDGLPPSTLLKWYEARKDKPIQVFKEVSLPEDFHQDLSKHPKALAWLLKMGITQLQIEEFKIGYSRYFDRLIFPVYMKSKLVFWQGRTFKPETKDNPKWLSVSVPRRQGVWFTAACHEGSDTVVLVEDMLSAMKVSNIAHSIALLGVYIPDLLVDKLQKSGKKVVVWLDRDKTSLSLKHAAKLRGRGIETRMRSTSLDPKKYSIQQLKEILQ